MSILDELPNDLGLSPLEVASGFVFGPDPTAAPLPDRVGTPRQELERVIRTELERPPCFIAFSGGRDSSAILALAVDVARREGLDEPIPLTRRHEGAPMTDESGWQELVVRHLEVTNWERVVVSDDLDMIGDIALDALRRHGPLHPSFGHLSVPLYRAATGGSLLTGEGGDEFFDLRRMVYARRQIKRLGKGLTRARLSALAYTLAPVPVRRPWQLRDFRRSDQFFGWLRPEPKRTAVALLADRAASEPLGWSAFMRWAQRQRWATVPERMADLLAADAGARNVDPLYAPRVIAALANDRRFLGHPDRSAAYRAVFGDLLPDTIWDRSTKASFNEAVTTRRFLAFARDWDGTGFDDDLIDPDALRQEWLGEMPQVGALALLQLAWLRFEGVGRAADQD